MNTWYAFLHQQGATFPENNIISFGEHPGDYNDLLKRSTVTPLIHLGLLLIEGADAARFLQGQVTCDVHQLSKSPNLMGARCNPKGRVLNNFLLCQTKDEQLLLLMDKSLIQPCIDELSKFAAFFKAELLDASNDYQLIGISGEDASTLSKQMPSIHTYPLIDGRQIAIVPNEMAETAWQQLTPTATPVGSEFWRLQDIQAGLGYVQQSTTSLFIPQMLNLQAVGGISFKKGCYTGQEVVARMKYLGKLKRRMYRLAVDSSEQLEPGTPCYLPGQEQSVGNVVAAAYKDQEKQEVLAVLTDEAAKSSQLDFGKGGSIALEQLPLPYEIEI